MVHSAVLREMYVMSLANNVLILIQNNQIAYSML